MEFADLTGADEVITVHRPHPAGRLRSLEILADALI